MDVIDVDKMEHIKYLFGDQLFLGYIKFYAEQKEFGYLVSNNWKMNVDGKFRERYHDFYIDRDSFDESVDYSKLVVFRLALVDKRLKAINIVQYRIDVHSNLAIDNILYHDIIHIEEKQRYEHFQRDVSLFSLSRIERFKIIERCCEIYGNNGSEALLYALDNLVFAVGGEKQYSLKLHEEYENKDKELDTIRRMFLLIDNLTAQKIVLKHASLQFLAPHNVLLALVGKLNDEFALPSEVRSVHITKKLQDIIKEKRVFQFFYDENNKTAFCNSEEETKKKQRRFLHMLKYCPDEIKESLAKEINMQVREGIQRFILEIDNKTRLEKKHLLEYCSDYIDETQKALIEKSFKIDDIKEYLKRLSSDLQLSFSYYPLDFNLNSITKEFYQQSDYIRNEARPILINAILQKIDNKLNVAYVNGFDEIIDIVYSNIFILEECHEQAICIIKNKFKTFCEKNLLSWFYSDKFPKLLNKIFEQEEIDILLDSYSTKVLSAGSLNNIHSFFNTFELSYPTSYSELINNRDLSGLLDCGNFFSDMPDYGCSLLGVIFDKIRANTNGNGDFLTDYNIQSDRCCFLTRLINTIKDKDSIKVYMMTLSNHDRIVLTLSRKINNDFLTIDDVKQELQSIGAEVDNDDILQILPQSSIAIAEIILSSECKTDADIHNILLWLRKYYTIENRKYKDIDERNYYEGNLLKYFAGLERDFHIEVKNYGIDLDNNFLPLSYGDYEPFKFIINELAKTKVENSNSHMIITIPKNIVSDDGIRDIIEKLFETSLEIRDDIVCLEISRENNIYTSTTIRSYIALNILNNLHMIVIKKKNTDIIPFDNHKMMSYITSIFNMKFDQGVGTYSRFKWDGSEDVEINWKHIVIVFDSDIDEVTKSILLKEEPDLKSKNNRILEYHDGPDFHTGCTNGPIGEMTIRLFKAYKEGLLN